MEEPESSVRSAAESDTSSQCSPRSWVEPRGGGRGPGGGPERHAPGPPEQKPHRDPSFQLEFQDSGLSPLLSLVPSHASGPHHSLDFSLLQGTGLEFVPLRASPDLSLAYDTSRIPSEDKHDTSLASEPGSLSQHPLAMTTIATKTALTEEEEGGSSCWSLSQHSLSPGDSRRKNHPEGTRAQPPAPADAGPETGSREDAPARNPPPIGRTADALPDVSSGANSSAASFASESSVKRTPSSATREARSGAGAPRLSAGRRERPRGGGGGAVESRQPVRSAPTGEGVPPEAANITVGSRDTHPDESSQALRRELLSEAELSRTSRGGGATRDHTHTPLPAPAPGTARGRPVGGNLAGVPAASGPPLPLGYGGVPGTGGRDFWSSGNQFDGSHLGLLPQSQSTPGVFNAPARSRVAGPLRLRGPARTETSPDPGGGRQDAPTSGTVPTLPTLNYMEKVDAWRANQSAAGQPSLSDSLALQAPKKRAHDAVADSLSRILRQQVCPDSAPSGATPSSSPRRGEAAGSGPASPLGRSQSHSSLSTVVGPLQTHAAPSRPSPLAALGRFSDGSTETDASGTLSPSRDGHRDLHRLLAASTSPSSVVSLEVDNYAPYWTASRPATPPPPPPAPAPTRARELNIEERIPLYLHNLGIDQSPSTILTPFGPRGPIREPEFSPTDLLTIEGSVGTKSSQPWEGDSPHKPDVSQCSVLSLDSSVSVTLSVDSLCPAAHAQPTVSPSPDQPPSDSQTNHSLASHTHASGSRSRDRHAIVSHASGSHASGSHASGSQVSSNRSSDRHARVSHASARHASGSHVSSNRSSDRHARVSHASARHASGSHAKVRSAHDHHAGVSRSSSSQTSISTSVGAGRVPVRLSDRFEASSSSTLTDSTARDRKSLVSPPQASSCARRTAAEAPVGTYTPATQNPLGVSSSSSSTMPKSRPHSDDDLLLALRRRGGAAVFQDSAFTSWSGAGGLDGSSSSSPPRWARSSSDSMLAPRDSGPSPRRPDHPPSQPAGQLTRQEAGSVSGSSQPPPLVAKTTRRAEPEGCSAAPPDGTNVPMTTMLAVPAVEMSAGPQTTPDPRLTPDPQLTPEPQLTPDRQLTPDPRLTPEPQLTSDRQLTPDPRLTPEPQLTPDRQLTPEPRLTPDPQTTSEPRLTPEPTEAPEEEEPGSPAPSPSSPASVVEAEPAHGVLSDGNSSDSSLAVRVAKLLQSESSFTMTTSSSSTATDREDPRAREWLRLKVSGQRCESLEMDTEDRRRIEEIKREILLLRPLQNITSTDTESSTVSSLRGRPLRPTDAAPPGPRPGLEARVREIAAREGQHAARRERADRKSRRPASCVLAGAGKPGFRETHPPAPPHGTGSSDSPSPPDSPSTGGHVSHLHLTLSPKPPGLRTHAGAPPAQDGGPPSREFSPLPRTTTFSTAAAATGSGGAGAKPCDTREPIRGRAPQRAATSALFRAGLTADARTSSTPSRPPQSFTPSRRPGAAHGAAHPVLLPYKPRGSEELFYVPQSEASFSPERCSSTAESTHPGSDDAVPPRFGPGVLGTTDPGVDRGVSFRHTEGVYSKRLRTGGVPGSPLVPHTGPSSRLSSAPLPSMHLSGARRDQGTSPGHSFSDSQSEESAGEFQPMAYETDRGTSTREYADAHNSGSSSGSEGRRHFGQLVQSQQTGASLGQLWQRFNEGRSPVAPHPTNESEPSLLLRLERLKRLLHGEGGGGGGGGGGVVPGTGRGVSTSGPPAAAEQGGRRPEVTGDDGGGHPRWLARTQEEESLSPASSHSSPAHGRHRFPAERDGSETLSTSRGSASTVDTERLVRAFGSDRVRRSLTPGSPSLGKLYHAIHQQREAGEAGESRGEGLERIREGGERREEEGERSEGTRRGEGGERTREGGERSEGKRGEGGERTREGGEKSEGRRGEGGERTREGGERSEERRGEGGERTREEGWERTREGGERKREAEEQRREGGGTTEDTPPWVPSSQRPGAESRAGSVSSATSYVLTDPRTGAPLGVRLVNRGVQAGDLEFVTHATRHNTRDVGTTFPSPADPRRDPQVSVKERRGSRRSQSKPLTKGVTWFVATEDEPSDDRKENRPEKWAGPRQQEGEGPGRGRGSVWFEAYCRSQPWREPLRERQVQEDGTGRHQAVRSDPRPDQEPLAKTTSSRLVPLSLQESLAQRRPGFVTRSRERLRRLALQAEERRLQGPYCEDGEQRPYRAQGAPCWRAPHPTGASRRAVPRKEMILRSKLIYEQLPEVQRRRKEEQRRKEYSSYRLNAQLFNKRITSRVLARRPAWQAF